MPPFTAPARRPPGPAGAARRCATGRARLCVLALAAAAPCAGAGPLEVLVSDASGRALAGTVVFLESREASAAVRPASGVEIVQQARQFAPQVTVVPVGSAVGFPNRDTVRHPVYSFSPTRKFEIKLYVGTPTAPVVFDQPGIAVLGCNIHDQMAVVVDSPWYGQTGADGRISWPQVPVGAYRLRTWHPALAVGAPAAEQPLRVDAAPTQAAVRLVGLSR